MALALPPARSPRHEDARNAVLTAAKLAYERSRCVSYSRRPEWYVGRDFYRGDTFRHSLIMSAVSDGQGAGLIIDDRVLPGRRGLQSTFRATPRLYALLEGAPVEPRLQRVIVLRDERKGLIEYPETMETLGMQREIEAINNIMAESTVDLNRPKVRKLAPIGTCRDADIVPIAPRVGRVFNRGSFDFGGRLYGWWQGIPRKDRPYLVLDGEPVLEPDYAQIHAQIIYAQRGLPLVGDAYETGVFPREAGKKAFNIALNRRTSTDRGQSDHQGAET